MFVFRTSVSSLERIEMITLIEKVCQLEYDFRKKLQEDSHQNSVRFGSNLGGKARDESLPSTK